MGFFHPANLMECDFEQQGVAEIRSSESSKKSILLKTFRSILYLCIYDLSILQDNFIDFGKCDFKFANQYSFGGKNAEPSLSTNGERCC